MIGLLHGYLLEGSGSNLWTRAIAQALVRAGHDVHLFCQENRAQDYDFIAAAHVYEPDGRVATLFERPSPYAGRCVLHKPRLGDTLPVYVGDHYDEFANVVPMVDLPDAAIEDYLAKNAAVVERVVRQHGIRALHANHAVLMSVVAERVGAATGVPYAVMPHGSAIEYAVRKDRRFHSFAAGALGRAGRVFVIGEEMRARVLATFPELTDLGAKLTELNLGVDTAAFRPAGRDERAGRIDELRRSLDGLERGRRPAAERALRRRLDDRMGRAELAAAIAEAQGYPGKLPDAGLEAKLARVDWAGDRLMLFVGRLIAPKGLQSVLAALPPILAADPGRRLIVVGHGPGREVMEAFLWALQMGARRLARNIVDWGGGLEDGGADRPFEEVRLFFDGLAARGELDAYFATAKRVIRPNRVLFTGYLTHRELRHLFPCCDVAVFPSVVAEAGPLVFLEALASGCFPLGTYFAGMAASIDSVADGLTPEQAALMKLAHDPAGTVADIARNADRALASGGIDGPALHRLMAERYDWTRIAGKLAAALSAMAGGQSSANSL